MSQKPVESFASGTTVGFVLKPIAKTLVFESPNLPPTEQFNVLRATYHGEDNCFYFLTMTSFQPPLINARVTKDDVVFIGELGQIEGVERHLVGCS